MKKTTLLCLLLAGLFLQTGYAQSSWRIRKEERSREKVQRKENRKNIREERIRERESGDAFMLSNTWAIYTTPTALLNPYGSLLPVGISYYFGQHFSAAADIAIPLLTSPLQWTGDSYSRKVIHSDFMIRADVKWYARVKHTRRFFVGIEGTFRKQHFTNTRGNLHYGNSWYGTGSLDAYKTATGAGLFFGGEFRLKTRWLLEGRVGLGIRNIHIRHNFNAVGHVPVNDKFFNPNVPPNEDEIGDQAIVIYTPLSLSIKYLLH